MPYLIGNNALQEAEKMFGVDSAEYDEAIQTQQCEWSGSVPLLPPGCSLATQPPLALQLCCTHQSRRWHQRLCLRAPPAADLISAGLIICGIMTMVQVTAIPLPFKRQIGAGILSVMGISFTTFSPANSTIQSERGWDVGWRPLRKLARSFLSPMLCRAFSCSHAYPLLGLACAAELIGEGETFNEAYGKVLGTAALCALVPVAISFLPHRAIKRIFPPVVCGVTIVLIGINLCGVGMKVGVLRCSPVATHLLNRSKPGASDVGPLHSPTRPPPPPALSLRLGVAAPSAPTTTRAWRSLWMAPAPLSTPPPTSCSLCSTPRPRPTPATS